jgi:hypothetical protein
VQAGKKVSRCFLIASCDGPKMLDYAEEPLDEIALAVKSEVAVTSDFPVGSGRDDHADLPRRQAFDEVIGVVALVAKQSFWLDLRHQCFGLGDVVHLATRQAESQWVAEGIDDYVDFRREPAA